MHHEQSLWSLRAKNGIARVDRLVEQVITRPPYNDTRLLFWIVDNCSAHRGCKAAQTLARSVSAVDAGPRTCLRQLVETGRNLLLHRAPQGSIPERPFRTWKHWQNDCSIFSTTGNQRLSRLNRNSLAKILPNCSQNSKISRRHNQEIRDRVNETMYEGPYHPS